MNIREELMLISAQRTDSMSGPNIDGATLELNWKFLSYNNEENHYRLVDCPKIYRPPTTISIDPICSSVSSAEKLDPDSFG